MRQEGGNDPPHEVPERKRESVMSETTTADSKPSILDQTTPGRKTKKKWAFVVSWYQDDHTEGERHASALFRYIGEAWVYAKALRDSGIVDGGGFIFIDYNRE
jgi:hypothetical protein